MYSLTVTVNYPNHSQDFAYPKVNSQRELYELSRDWLNAPGITSVTFVVVPLFGKDQP